MSASPDTRRVLDAIRRSLQPAWACVEEVDQIDVLAVGLHRSTGYRRHGFEVKVTRSDWLRELARPQKARTHLTHGWSVAALQGVVKLEEVPEGWGVYELVNARLYCRRQPKWAVTAAARLRELTADLTGYYWRMLSVTVARRAAYAESDARALVKHWPGTEDELESALREAQNATGRLLPGIGVYGRPRR